MVDEKFCPRLNESEICMKGADGKSDTCKGDSGSGVIGVNEKGEPVLYALVSHGEDCANFANGYYADVARVVDWVRDEVQRRKSTLDFP